MPRSFPDRIRSLPEYEGRFDAYKLNAQDCDVLFASYPAGTDIPPHTHDTDNHGIITRGELILTMKGQTQRFRVGDWYHIAAHAEHAARFEVDTDVIEFWFEVDQK